MRVRTDRPMTLISRGLWAAGRLAALGAAVVLTGNSLAGPFDLNAFHDAPYINAYLVDLTSQAPDSFNRSAATTDIATGLADPIRVLHLGTGGGPKPAVLITAGQYANEWLSTSATLVIADRLLNGTDADAVHCMLNYDFYIVPLTNPAGYQYSRTTTSWTRNDPANGDPCGAIALDRNWSVGWDGANTDTCSSDYPGTAPMTAYEVDALSTYIAALPNLLLHLDLRSRPADGTAPPLGAWIATPWGRSSCALPDAAILDYLANVFRSALTSTYGTTMDTGELRDLRRRRPGRRARIDHRLDLR